METREIKEKVLRIMALAMEVSTIHEYPHKGNHTDVFVNFIANISALDVTVYKNGFDKSADPDRKWEVYLYKNDMQDVNKKCFSTYGCAELDNIIAYLEDLKNAEL